MTHNAPFAHVTFKNFDDAVAVVESAKQEPFYMEGRKVHIAYSQKKPKYGPSQRLFFDNFVGGNLVALRNFLGEHAVAVDNAYFSKCHSLSIICEIATYLSVSYPSFSSCVRV